MNPTLFFKIAVASALLVAATLFVVARTNRGTAVSNVAAAPAETPGDASHFKEGNGVRLGKAAWNFIRPATAEIETMEVAPGLKIEARVYTAAIGSRPAFASATTPAGLAPSVDDAVQLSGQAGELPVWQGRVAQIDRQMEQVSGQIEAIIEITDPEMKLAAGAFLAVYSGSAATKKASVIMAPQSAVVQSSKGPFVYASNGDYFLRTPVKLGIKHDDKIEIVDGLFEGDKVASQGADALWMVELQATNGGKSCTEAGH